ncbi:MAG: antibiotic biosynthesis monooxygenase family protein [Saprospiraceae bacterium]
MTRIRRIVRLTFADDHVIEFLDIYRESSPYISTFAGCIHLSLMKDADHAHIFYTVSEWASPEALENYRQSELFRATWAKTKLLFSDRPRAYSLQEFDI